MSKHKALYAQKDAYRSAEGILSLMLQGKQSEEGFAEFQAVLAERRESTRWSLFHSVLQTPTQLSAPLQAELRRVRNDILRPSAVSKDLLVKLELSLSDSLSQSDSLSSQPLLGRLAELNTYEREAQELSVEELEARINDLQDKLAKVESELLALQPEIMREDLALSFALRVRCALDVAKGIRVMHSCSPPMAHNDIRSPNVFLVTLEDSAPIHAKLADFGLAREAIGNLHLKLAAWQWLAPEVIAGTAGFNIEADIYSFGIVMWELISGAGLNIPFAEFLSQKEIQIRQAILKENLRPTILEYTQKSFEQDPMFEPYTRLLYRCLCTAVRDRPTAHEVCAELHHILGIPDPDAHRYIPAVQGPRFELTHRTTLAILDTTPRVSGWTCSRCGKTNERSPEGFLPTHCRSCSMAQPPSRSTPTAIALGRASLYVGLKAGQVQAYARDHLNRDLGPKYARPRPDSSPLLFSFPSNRPVLRLFTLGRTLWAISQAFELVVLNHQHQRLLTTTLPGPVTSVAQTTTRVFLAVSQSVPGEARSWIYVYTTHESRLELQTLDYQGFITDLLVTDTELYVAAETVSVYSLAEFPPDTPPLQPLRSHKLPQGKYFTRMLALTPRHLAVLYDPFNLAILDAQGFERLASIALNQGVRSLEPLPDGTLLILTRTELHYLPLLAPAPVAIPLPSGEYSQHLLQRGIAHTFDLWLTDQASAQIVQYHIADTLRPERETAGDLPQHWDQTDLPVVELGPAWLETLSGLLSNAPSLLLQSVSRLQVPSLYRLYTSARTELLTRPRPPRPLRQPPLTWHSWASDLGLAGLGALNEVYLLLPYEEPSQVASTGLTPTSGPLGEGFYLYDALPGLARTTLLVVRVLLGAAAYVRPGQAAPPGVDSVVCSTDGPGQSKIYFIQNSARLYPEFILECTRTIPW
jgi:serine/threonine protein kinase